MLSLAASSHPEVMMWIYIPIAIVYTVGFFSVIWGNAMMPHWRYELRQRMLVEGRPDLAEQRTISQVWPIAFIALGFVGSGASLGFAPEWIGAPDQLGWTTLWVWLGGIVLSWIARWFVACHVARLPDPASPSSAISWPERRRRAPARIRSR